MNGFFQFAETPLTECKLSKFVKEFPNKSLDYKELDKPITNVNYFSDCPIGRLSENKPFNKPLGDCDKRLIIVCENPQNLPKNDGHWEGNRGNSIWKPDRDYVPPEKKTDKPYSNPDKLTWGEILDKYGIVGIPFKDGFPDFSEISKGSVQIEGFEPGGSAEKNRNFKKADIELAKQHDCSPDEVARWRKENNCTWHECEDKKTMQKMPNEIHANVKHEGGRSQD